MKLLKRIMINQELPIYEAMKILCQTSLRILLVIDQSTGKLLGTLTDGDIRFAFLKNKSFSTKIKDVMNPHPITVFKRDNLSQKNMLELMVKKQIQHLPILNNKFQPIDLIKLDNLIEIKDKKNAAVIMAGGQGNRLKPLTEETPKPLLKIGDKPILEIIIENLKLYGFRNIFITINYKSEQIKNYFQDGSQFDVNIEYIEEKKKLGTAGGLAFLKNKIDAPFIVINGDILTKLNFETLFSFHNKNRADLTVTTKLIEKQSKYGILKIKNKNIIDIVEKPLEKNFINAGIYVLNSEVLEFIPKNKECNITEIIKILLNKNKKILYYPVKEYWLDIGHIEDYELAQQQWK